MEFINKQNNQPAQWNTWFTTANGSRSYNYALDYQQLTLLPDARQYLILEQQNLCAYCQRDISLETSSIEHVIPKSVNIALSTNYHNLVAVCKGTSLDHVQERMTRHCDKSRLNKHILPLFFFQDCKVSFNLTNQGAQNNSYIKVKFNGTILAKENLPVELQQFVNYMIHTILNLNHPALVEERRNAIAAITAVLATNSANNARRQMIFNLISNLAANTPHRFYTQVFFCQRLGFN